MSRALCLWAVLTHNYLDSFAQSQTQHISEEPRFKTFTEGALLKKVSSRAPELNVITSPKNCLIGELSFNLDFSRTTPNAYCVDDTYYVGAQFRVGSLNLFGETAETLTARAGLVMISAEERRQLWSQLKARGACPERSSSPIQFRSDWYAREGGYQNSRESLQSTPYLKLLASPVTPLELMKITAPKIKPRRRARPPSESVIITLNNPFPIASRYVRLVLHYERDGGKPIPHYESLSIQLNPQEKMTLQIAMRLIRSRDQSKRTWTFIDAQLRGELGGCRILSTSEKNSVKLP